MSTKIIAIKVSLYSVNRATLLFSDSSFLPIDSDSLQKLSLKKHQTLSPPKIQKIAQASALYLLKNYALRQIAISAKTEKILQQKLLLFAKKTQKKFQLLSKLYFPPLIQQTLSYIKDRGLLHPQEFVDRILRTHRYKSFFYITSLLRQSGVDPQYFPVLQPQQEFSKIKKILNKKNIKKIDLSDYNAKNKIISSLARRGFSYPDIKLAIDDIKKLS